MAIVPDLSGNSPLNNGVDLNFAGVSRVVTVAPYGTLVPVFSGEIVHDTTTQTLWTAIGLTNVSWVLAQLDS